MYIYNADETRTDFDIEIFRKDFDEIKKRHFYLQRTIRRTYIMSSVEITSGRFILTLPLKTELYQEHILEKRFRLGEQLYNKFLNFEKRSTLK